MVKNQIKEVIPLSEVSDNDIQDILKNMKTSKATGDDKI